MQKGDGDNGGVRSVLQVQLRRIDDDDGEYGLSEQVCCKAGSTVLGRGPLLKCKDTRISRNHAVLEVEDNGTCALKSISENPSYVWKCGESSPAHLQKGESRAIQAGDHIGLLPDKYRYSVTLSTSPKRVLPEWMHKPVDLDKQPESNTDNARESTHRPSASCSISASPVKILNKIPDDHDLEAAVQTNSTVDVTPQLVVQKKPVCRYGAVCYRTKNPEHCSQFSHPGDEDYQPLPECPYGQGCYRKSSDHRQNFSHNLPAGQGNHRKLKTTSKQKKTVKRKKTTTNTDYDDYDDSEDDEDDEPFLNDEESDYEPTESESADSDSAEDVMDTDLADEVQQTKKAGKKFVQKRT